MGVPLKMRWTIGVAAVGLGVEGLGSAFFGPGADAAIITTAWVAMITTLAAQADVNLEKHTVLKIVSALILSIGTFFGGAKLAVQAFAVTGVGTVPAMLANLGMNAAITYVVGISVAKIFVEEKRVDSIEGFVSVVVRAILAAFGLGDGT